jgi:hypothetical protein
MSKVLAFLYELRCIIADELMTEYSSTDHEYLVRVCLNLPPIKDSNIFYSSDRMLIIESQSMLALDQLRLKTAITSIK